MMNDACEPWSLVDPASSLETDEKIVHTSLLFNSRHKRFDQNVTLTINKKSGLFSSVTYRPSFSIEGYADHPDTLDLRGHTVVPGLVDAHTHIFVHDYAETPATFQERDESLVERIVRGTNHLRLALKAGYTTYRDLGTEGLGDADVGLRDAVNRGIIPGPRLYVATQPLASSGSYEIRYESRMNGTTVPPISDPCDGVAGVMAGVRRRIGAGADFIKFYGEYRRRVLRFPEQRWPGALPIQFPPEGRNAGKVTWPSNPSLTMWSQEEMDAIVAETRRAHAPVAAHCIEPETVIMACKAGVTTVEHSYVRDPTNQTLQAMKDNNVIWIPTLSVLYSEAPDSLDQVLKYVKKGYDMGVRIGCGGDTGAYPHGENVLELELLLKAGIPIEEVLRAATLTGWEACGGDWCGRRFGYAGEGWAADLVALDGDLREDVKALRKVVHVVKDGRLVVKDGGVVGL